MQHCSTSSLLAINHSNSFYSGGVVDFNWYPFDKGMGSQHCVNQVLKMRTNDGYYCWWPKFWLPTWIFVPDCYIIIIRCPALVNILPARINLIFNSLWPSDAIWCQRSGSTLDQVMVCCLTAPSHYLNQCWLIITKVLQHLPEGNFVGNAPDIYHWYHFEND